MPGDVISFVDRPARIIFHEHGILRLLRAKSFYFNLDITGTQRAELVAAYVPPAVTGPEVALHFAYYNFCRVHQSLRVTPSMEAGITDHVWTLDELLAS